MKLKLMLSAILSFTLLLSCESNNKRSLSQTITTSEILTISAEGNTATEISVMTFNGENVFDTLHDEGTEDYTYLPLSLKASLDIHDYCESLATSFYRKECHELDWNDAVVDAKVTNLANVIRYANDNQGPDILIMQEIENLNVLELIFNEKLKDLGYQTLAILKGPDPRGINNAIISKFPLAKKPVLHIIEFDLTDPSHIAKANKTRGIMEAVVLLPNGKELTLLSVHFASQSNPTIMRQQSLEYLKNLMQKYEKEGRAVITGGDFNITSKEDKQYNYFQNILAPISDVSHLVGCESCKGSIYYRNDGTWSFFDVLAFGKGLANAGLELDNSSIQLIMAPGHKKSDGTPMRFNSEWKNGVSDHFPMFGKLKIK